MKEVESEAKRRKVELVMLPTSQAIDVLNKNPKATNAILHVTRRLLQIDPIARLNITVQLALHDHSAGNDIGFNAPPVRPDRQTVSFRVDSAIHLAIYIKVFAAPLTSDIPVSREAANEKPFLECSYF